MQILRRITGAQVSFGVCMEYVGTYLVFPNTYIVSLVHICVYTKRAYRTEHDLSSRVSVK
jgi:hypothetical protein